MTATESKRGRKPGSKSAPKSDAPAKKKLAQTTLKTKAPSKKRPKPDSEDEDDIDPSPCDDSVLSATPPQAKKQKTAPTKKNVASRPLREIENEAINEAIDASMMLDGSHEAKPQKGSKSTEQYQKVQSPASLNMILTLICVPAYST